MTCRAEGCEKEAKRDGLCWGHAKRKSLGQTVSGELVERPMTPWECVTEAAMAYADAEGFDKAEFERAKDNLRKSSARYGRKQQIEAIRAALAEAKARGVHVGRPRKLSRARAEEALAAAGSIRAAAKQLGVTRETLRKALGQGDGQKPTLSDQVSPTSD